MPYVPILFWFKFKSFLLCLVPIKYRYNIISINYLGWTFVLLISQYIKRVLFMGVISNRKRLNKLLRFKV